MEKTTISSKNAPKAVGPYSQAIRTNGLVFISGQLGLDPATGELRKGGIVPQAEQALDNVVGILNEINLTVENVVKTTIFIHDMNDFSKVNDIYKKYFTNDYPARSCIEVSSLPKNGEIEIEAIAVI
jgi:2-iminobutanoate/2-iminopropanoate deaminase